jgi:hypothetical protein
VDDIEDGYRGPATLSLAGRELTVDVDVTGEFQPLDGRYHWWGRLSTDDTITSLIGRGNAQAVLSTPHGHAPGSVGDPDLWNRYRVEGTSTPPFPVPDTPAAD